MFCCLDAAGFEKGEKIFGICSRFAVARCPRFYDFEPAGANNEEATNDI
jgi:hypothetical protein